MVHVKDALTVGLYLVDKDIRELFYHQFDRMGDMMAKVEDAMIQKNLNPAWKRQDGGLKNEWNEYMKDIWKEATDKLTTWIDTKLQELVQKNDCGFTVNVQGTSNTKSPYEAIPDTPEEDECAYIAFIHDSWVGKVKESKRLKKFPSLSELESEPESEPEPETGDKRGRPNPNQQNSSEDVPKHTSKKGKERAKSPTT